MILYLGVFFIIMLAFKIIFSIKGNLFLKYLFTPLTTVCILLLPLLYLYGNQSRYAVLITLALIFSLIGDIFNMVEDKADFVSFGIIFFMLAHVLYIYNFIQGYSFQVYHIFIIIFIIGVLILSSIIFKFDSNIKKIMIGFYTIMVSVTMLAAIGNLTGHPTSKALLIASGTVLFWLSDLILGVHLFYKN